MGLFDVARELYIVARESPSLEAKIRDEHAALALEIATSSDAGFELTSSTVNGQSFAGTRTMTKLDRLRMLGQVVAMFNNRVAVRSTGSADFGEYGT